MKNSNSFFKLQLILYSILLTSYSEKIYALGFGNCGLNPNCSLLELVTGVFFLGFIILGAIKLIYNNPIRGTLKVISYTVPFFIIFGLPILLMNMIELGGGLLILAIIASMIVGLLYIELHCKLFPEDKYLTNTTTNIVEFKSKSQNDEIDRLDKNLGDYENLDLENVNDDLLQEKPGNSGLIKNQGIILFFSHDSGTSYLVTPIDKYPTIPTIDKTITSLENNFKNPMVWLYATSENLNIVSKRIQNYEDSHPNQTTEQILEIIRMAIAETNGNFIKNEDISTFRLFKKNMDFSWLKWLFFFLLISAIIKFIRIQSILN